MCATPHTRKGQPYRDHYHGHPILSSSSMVMCLNNHSKDNVIACPKLVFGYVYPYSKDIAKCFVNMNKCLLIPNKASRTYKYSFPSIAW